VPLPNIRDRLSDRYHVTLILRLVLDRLHQLVYGEMLDADGEASQRFASWEELPAVIQSSLAAIEAPPMEPDAEPEEPRG
jgi:hypothetical protein